jgi:signal transduction histidine kinase
MSPQVVVVLDALRVVALVALGLASVRVLRHRQTAVGRPFSALVVVLTAWAALSILPGRFGVPAAPARLAIVVGVAEQVAAVAVAPLWLLYVARYTGRGQRVTRRLVVVVLAPVALVPLIAVVMAAVGGPTSPVVLGAVFAGFVLLAVYGIGVYLVGVYLLARLARQYRQLRATQVVTLAAAIVAPYLLVAVSSISEPTDSGGTAAVLSVDVAAVGFLLTGLLTLFATRRYPLFTAFPASEHVARDTVLEELDEAVVILDEDDVVLDLNPAAAALSDRSTEALLGQPVTAAFDGLARVPAETPARVGIRAPDGEREVEVSTSAITDGDDGLLGRTVLLRDVTERETREQQLEVLTRVLRHNLRNDLDTLLAYTEEVEDPAVREQLSATVKRLGATASKARTVEEMLAVPQEAAAPVDVSATVRSVADRFREEHPDCSITVEAPDELVVRSHRALIERVATELVENAIEHNDRAEPTVAVAVRAERASADQLRVEVEVADDGPGIPDWDRDVIEREQESALQHGTGLGLWLVNWIATSLHGSLSFAAREPRGSVVTVAIRAPPAEE